MKLALTSDIHGALSALIPPEPVDVLVIAGDIVPVWAVNNPAKKALMQQADWVIQKFYPFLRELIVGGRCTHVVWTWGNHDWVGQYHNWQTDKNTLLPEPPSGCHLLVDRSCTIDGVKFYGTPWQPQFYNWAFNADEADLAERWAAIPDDTDVLVVHGPPHKYGDRVGNQHCGSPSLAARVASLHLEMVVCGHIHVGAGAYRLRGNHNRMTHVYNVSAVNEAYKVVRQPLIVEV